MTTCIWPTLTCQFHASSFSYIPGKQQSPWFRSLPLNHFSFKTLTHSVQCLHMIDWGLYMLALLPVTEKVLHYYRRPLSFSLYPVSLFSSPSAFALIRLLAYNFQALDLSSICTWCDLIFHLNPASSLFFYLQLVITPYFLFHFHGSCKGWI